MKQVLLDTNFILSCIRNKIDFFEELSEYKILIPKQVIRELKNLNEEFAIRVLEKHKRFFKIIGIKSNYVDKGIINFSKENPNTVIATLDKDLKNKIKNQKLVIRGKKKLEIA